jgi:hypothetical protein
MTVGMSHAHCRLAVVLVGAGGLPFQGLRGFGLLAAGEFQDVAVPRSEEIVGADRGNGRPAAQTEADRALGRDGVVMEAQGDGPVPNGTGARSPCGPCLGIDSGRDPLVAFAY